MFFRSRVCNMHSPFSFEFTFIRMDVLLLSQQQWFWFFMLILACSLMCFDVIIAFECEWIIHTSHIQTHTHKHAFELKAIGECQMENRWLGSQHLLTLSFASSVRPKTHFARKKNTHTNTAENSQFVILLECQAFMIVIRLFALRLLRITYRAKRANKKRKFVENHFVTHIKTMDDGAWESHGHAD